ncbi:klebicin B-related nuclease bacteriocin (plasmid) [Klebsiella pneumoniae]|nr:klebicin B-related nuclease bacteriocin [Klebsiella pneumoniae]EKT8378165.1 klebicin B-related nuclease bacteriocin [Klebsiella pneumoniae]EKU6239562.1 klebicin B-related nuclease bacteriocin [Klebsiella pneumoniae]EKW4519780.1 klebicin B-related nuclease bacteriocin [Klebsiella pneumoniae]EKW5633694.1 klebicin B-related nuclease bacteriocin [Klebsiella pneumoniae]EKZ5419168.1 klebicin B-related nuclease bacteriocin [Klebsiella pneumoniae]
MIGGFNYNGEGATSSGLSSPSASDVANQFNSFGGTQIRASDVSNIRSDGNGGYMADIRGQIHTVSSEEGSTTVSGFDGVRSSSTGNGGSQGGQGPQGQSLVMHNGQMGYWENRSSGAGNNEHTTRAFVAVGPSEAEKAARAEKVAKEKQQAEEAAKAFAAKTAAASAAAEKERQNAISAAAAAGQHQTVPDARNNLNQATAEASRLKTVADNALNTAKNKRKEAIDAVPVATQAEKKYQDLQQSIKGLTLNNNGQYGTQKWEVISSNKEHDHWGYRFYPSGITKAQVDAAQNDAVNKRNAATSLASQATAAEQASLQASAAYNAAETRRQAAQAALASAEQAAAAERKRQEAEAAAAAAAKKKRQADAAAKAAEEARAIAEKAKALQARCTAADKLKSSEIQAVRGIPATAAPFAIPLTWSTASRGGFTLSADAAASLGAFISEALATLSVAVVANPVALTIAGLVLSKSVGVGSDMVPGRDISSMMPGDAFGLPDTAALNKAADQKTSVSMPVRGRLVMNDSGILDVQLVKTNTAGAVKVARAVLDKETGYWGYTLPAVADVPAQTIFVSPADALGANGPLTLSGPVPLPERILHTGDQISAPQATDKTVTPVADDLDFDDIILVFPPESGLKPLYVMYRSPRNMPGTVSGKGQNVGNNWMGGASTGDGAPVPSQIADKLRGKTFGSFDSSRRAFWKAVADDSALSKQFSEADINQMKAGRAPTADFLESVGKRVKIELHHEKEISQGGAVMDVDNIKALTPKNHIETHKGK